MAAVIVDSSSPSKEPPVDTRATYFVLVLQGMLHMSTALYIA
jgi:hypothetical protein